VTVDDGQSQADPGAAMAYLIELRNAGPDNAPNTQLALVSDPTLIDAQWMCVAVGTAVCPTTSGAAQA
jgi:hypothetical protein